MSDFKGEDYDFALGTIKGLRSWRIDDKGRLRGVSHQAIWTPGENVAKCAKGAGRYDPCPSSYRPGILLGGTSGPCGDPTCTPRGHFVAMEPHTFDPDCQCGFWAYDEVGFEEHGDVVGVIEGYGRTTIGTKGFRCEKARIAALCRETEDAILTLSEWLRLKQLYPDVEFFDEHDDMVLAHGQVMRAWAPIDEDFWTEEPPPSETSKLLAALNGMAASFTIPSVTFPPATTTVRLHTSDPTSGATPPRPPGTGGP